MKNLRQKSTALLSRAVHVRMADWALAALILLAVVALIAPQQLGVSVYKMSLIALAALAGYWIDRSAFPYARPDSYFDPPKGGQETTFTAIRGVVNFTERVIDPDKADDDQLLTLARTAMLRRALIMAATMLAVSLGA